MNCNPLAPRNCRHLITTGTKVLTNHAKLFSAAAVFIGVIEKFSDSVRKGKTYVNRKVMRFVSALLLAVSIHTTFIAYGATSASPTDQSSTRSGEVEIKGTLTSFEGTIMIVAGHRLDVNQAEIQPGLVVGEWVKVHATRASSGSWVAREVQRDAGDDDDNPERYLEITGTVEALIAGSITVNGVTISWTRNTEFAGSIAVGNRVKVEFLLVDDQAEAREVKQVLPGDDDDDDDDDDSED